MTLGGSASAESPYNTPYGVQWSFMIGHAGADNPNAVAASPDGTIWIGTGGAGNSSGSPMLTWGSDTGVYGGSWASGYGQISRNGGILQGNDIPNMAVNNFNQTYSANIAFSGDNPTAYFGSNPNRAMNWTDASPADTSGNSSQPMTFAVESVLGVEGNDPFCYYQNAPGDPLSTVLPRANTAGLDPTKKFTFDLVSAAAYGGSAFDFKVDSEGSYFIARGAQGANTIGDPLTNGDSFTPGDYSGPVAQSYKPAVGKILADGITKSGPAHQPACGGRSFFSDIDINEDANGGEGKVFALGYGRNASGGTMDFFDPDGPGPMASIPIDSTRTDSRTGFAMVYNATTWAIEQVVILESTYGRDIATDITATADGGFVLVCQTYGSLGGFINPAEGTYDGYIAVYDAAGTLAWDYQTETLADETYGDVTVDADGSFYVSGNSDGNPFVTKFDSAGTVIWTSTIDNEGTAESQRDHAGDKLSIFILNEGNPSGGGTLWPNTIGYVPQGNDEVLLQKLSPGDFNEDGFVDFADVQLAGDATKPGLTSDDTYDFNEDGDSTFADTEFMITTIMDRIIGDIHQDSAATDVDNADIGKAIGSHNGAAGTGKLYVDGDIDFDGNVDDDDITMVAGAYGGALASSCKQAPADIGITLTYLPADGTVLIPAGDAAGGVITSFQLENAAGTFADANYSGPTGGSFDGTLKDVSTHVLADTDLSFAGTGDTLNLGTVLPLGMDLPTLEAYLTTAVYTGELGSGQKQFNLFVDTQPTNYAAWVGLYPALTDTDPSLDFDGDGLETGVEYVVGGNPIVKDNAGLSPTASSTESGLEFTFRRTDLANGDADITIAVQYGSDLLGWTDAEEGVNGVSIETTDEFYGEGIDQVVVTVPTALSSEGKIFARLRVTGFPG